MRYSDPVFVGVVRSRRLSVEPVSALWMSRNPLRILSSDQLFPQFGHWSLRNLELAISMIISEPQLLQRQPMHSTCAGSKISCRTLMMFMHLYSIQNGSVSSIEKKWALFYPCPSVANIVFLVGRNPPFTQTNK